MTNQEIQQRLDYIRSQIQEKNMSYDELVELQTLVDYIPDYDTELLEWAGVPESQTH